MTKKELIKVVAEKLEKSQKETAELVDVVFDEIVKGLLENGEVRLSGFGKISVVERAARKARNPQTGEEMIVPAKKAIRFKAAKQLKDAVQ